MKLMTLTIAALAALAALCPRSAAAKPTPEPTIAACIHWDASLPELVPAKMTASRLFHDIGVRLIWTTPESCPGGGIHITPTRNVADNQHPGSLADAWLERRLIKVFLDRIEENSRGLAPYLLGYVLVHEITHVIQGVNRHSAEGVMKAQWEHRDLYLMKGNRLRFTQDDASLILVGLRQPAQPASAFAAFFPGLSEPTCFAFARHESEDGKCSNDRSEAKK